MNSVRCLRSTFKKAIVKLLLLAAIEVHINRLLFAIPSTLRFPLGYSSSSCLCIFEETLNVFLCLCPSS